MSEEQRVDESAESVTDSSTQVIVKQQLPLFSKTKEETFQILNKSIKEVSIYDSVNEFKQNEKDTVENNKIKFKEYLVSHAITLLKILLSIKVLFSQYFDYVTASSKSSISGTGDSPDQILSPKETSNSGTESVTASSADSVQASETTIPLVSSEGSNIDTDPVKLFTTKISNLCNTAKTISEKFTADSVYSTKFVSGEDNLDNLYLSKELFIWTDNLETLTAEVLKKSINSVVRWLKVNDASGNSMKYDDVDSLITIADIQTIENKHENEKSNDVYKTIAELSQFPLRLDSDFIHFSERSTLPNPLSPKDISFSISKITKVIVLFRYDEEMTEQNKKDLSLYAVLLKPGDLLEKDEYFDLMTEGRVTFSGMDGYFIGRDTKRLPFECAPNSGEFKSNPTFEDYTTAKTGECFPKTQQYDFEKEKLTDSRGYVSLFKTSGFYRRNALRYLLLKGGEGDEKPEVITDKKPSLVVFGIVKKTKQSKTNLIGSTETTNIEISKLTPSDDANQQLAFSTLLESWIDSCTVQVTDSSSDRFVLHISSPNSTSEEKISISLLENSSKVINGSREQNQQFLESLRKQLILLRGNVSNEDTTKCTKRRIVTKAKAFLGHMTQILPGAGGRVQAKNFLLHGNYNLNDSVVSEGGYRVKSKKLVKKRKVTAHKRKISSKYNIKSQKKVTLS